MPLNNPVSLAVFDPTVDIAKRVVSVPEDITQPVILAGVNENRKGLTVSNNSTGSLLLDFNNNPTVLDYAVKVNSNGYYELPYNFVGSVNAVWEEPSEGNALVREFFAK